MFEHSKHSIVLFFPTNMVTGDECCIRNEYYRHEFTQPLAGKVGTANGEGREGIGEWEIFWETKLLKVAQHQQRETLYQNPARKIENSKGNLLYYNNTIFDMRRNSTTTVDHSF